MTAMGLGRSLAATALLVAACGGGSSDGESAPATTAVTESPEPTPTTAPGAARSTFDDLNQDGVPIPRAGRVTSGPAWCCGVPCEPGYYANDPSEGTTLVPDSLSGPRDCRTT